MTDPGSSPLPRSRTRLAVGLISFALIGSELTFMQSLSLRFWHHVAYMIISVALLGLGASGALLTMLHRRVERRPRLWLACSAIACAFSFPLARMLMRDVPLDIQFMAWQLTEQLPGVLLLEGLLFLPFLFAGAAVGIALMDAPERIGGHYAANLIGSGLGGFGTVLLMYPLRTPALLAVMSLAAFLAGAVLMTKRKSAVAAVVMSAILLGGLLWFMPATPQVSAYKTLEIARHMPDTRILYTRHGPLGRLDVIEGPALHYAPGLSLQFQGELPPHVLLLSDGQTAGVVYDTKGHADWRFMDYTTGAVAHALTANVRTLVIGAGGGANVGLAQYYKSAQITGLEMNPQVVELMTGPLAERGGDIYQADGVEIVAREARGFLAARPDRFDVIMLPPLDAYGASGAGLYATQESYLYTIDSFRLMLGHLNEDGLLCLTRWARTPPRDGLRAFNLAAATLRQVGLDPAQHLVMIRNWATVSVLLSPSPFTTDECARIRDFCEERAIDLCYLFGLEREEANRFHKLDEPAYYDAAQMLLSERREEYVADYLFRLDAPTDDKPYYFHFFRWSSLGSLQEQLGGHTPAFLELGTLFLGAAFGQTALLSVVLILCPLLPRLRSLSPNATSVVSLTYFLMLGIGFMLLEMSLLQKLILYLAHPVYAASASISSFLIFAGVGSRVSRAWSGRFRKLASVAAVATALLGLGLAAWVDEWLALTQAQPVLLRFVIAALTIAPLAFAMGHLFPLGLRHVRRSAPSLAPWAWGVNGCAGVAATIGTPILAMQIGFSRVVWIAAGCYLLAGLLARAMDRHEAAQEQRSPRGAD